MDPKELKKGDPCPNCGGELKPLPAMSPEEHARAYGRESQEGRPEGVDTASPSQREALGELHKCACGYQARFADKKKSKSKSDAE